MIDSKKTHSIKHWMTKCGSLAREVVLESMQDSPFQMGPFGESLAGMGQLFLQSSADGLQGSADALAPLAHEDCIAIQWDLQLTEASQGMLFRRIKIAFDRATAIVDDVRDRKRYRMKPDEVVALRNLCALWGQIRAFCKTRLPDFDSFEQKLHSGNSMDDQFAEILQTCPSKFAISMLPVSQHEAACQLKRQEETVCLEAEQQQSELRAAKWRYFVAALERDQRQLSLVASAPEKLDMLRHRKTMGWRLEQAKVGEKIMMAYSEKFIRCRHIQQMEHMHEILHEYRAFVAPCSGIDHQYDAFSN